MFQLTRFFFFKKKQRLIDHDQMTLQLQMLPFL